MKKILNAPISTLLVGLFGLLLLVLALFAEVFESRTPEIDLAQIYANPIPIVELQRLQKVNLTNKYGSFEMINSHPEGELAGPWQLVSPQTQRVKNDIISKIMENLNILRVRSIHRYEPINITSFSLDNPNLSLLLTTSKNKDYEIKLGLINPIDNSAYLSISSQDQIYQIDPLEMALETYDLSTIIEARILAINWSEVKEIEILEDKNSKLFIKQYEETWRDSLQQEELSKDKVQAFLGQLDEMKSSSILENLTTEQVEHFQDLLNAQSWEIKIVSQDKVQNFFVTEIKRNLPGMGQQFKGQFLFSNSEFNSFSVVKKDQLRFLQTTLRNLK